MSAKSVLLIGAPGAGKSNFLIRSWLALRDGADRQIRPRGMPPNATYLNEGAAKLLAGEFIAHTPSGIDERSSIPILIDGQDAELLVPDRPGEDWIRLYKERRWPVGWHDLLAEGTSCLIMVRSVLPNEQAQDWLVMEHFLGPSANVRDADQTTAEPPVQVVLVDWIQLVVRFYKRKFGANSKPRIGIVVTAWDELEDAQQKCGPMDYLREEHKLLHDFIANNRENIDLEAFGVTIFGGDLNNSNFSDSVLNGEPRSLGSVVHQLGGSVTISSDFLLPIIWALGAHR